MPKYKFKAIDLGNNKVNAVVNAKDDDDFRKILRGRSLVPVSYKVLEDKRVTYRLKANETADFSRQLASMLASGITAVRAMEILKERDFKPPLRAILIRLHKDVQQGSTLSEAMRLQGRSFPELLMNMYASGEASGQLEHVASKMAEHYDKEHRLNGKVQAAMTYPIILLVVTVAVVMVVFVLILPTLFEMLEGMELPLFTRIMLAISGFLQSYWYMVIIGFLVVVAILQYLKTIPKVAEKMDLFKLRFPVVGKLLTIIYTARFARTLSSLYTSGVSMIKALEISATIIGNKYIESQFDGVVKDVRNGELLSASIAKVDGFDNKLPNTILIGEETGRLDTMLVSTAEGFDYEAEMATGRLVQLLEPVMLVVMAAIIGSIMVSVMLPMMDLYQNMGNL